MLTLLARKTQNLDSGLVLGLDSKQRNHLLRGVATLLALPTQTQSSGDRRSVVVASGVEWWWWAWCDSRGSGWVDALAVVVPLLRPRPCPLPPTSFAPGCPCPPTNRGIQKGVRDWDEGKRGRGTNLFEVELSLAQFVRYVALRNLHHRPEVVVLIHRRNHQRVAPILLQHQADTQKRVANAAITATAKKQQQQAASSSTV